MAVTSGRRANDVGTAMAVVAMKAVKRGRKRMVGDYLGNKFW